jgi:hypothetical protein
VFDSSSELLWSDLSVSNRKVEINLKNPKISSGWSNNVILFAEKKKTFCPIHWILKLEKLQKRKSIWNPADPVYKICKEKNLTRGTFLKIVKASLAEEGKSTKGISGKSFRSGIPSELESFPENFKERHLKSLGRWKSSAYQLYIRKDLPEKKKVQKRIAKTLLKNFSLLRRTAGSVGGQIEQGNQM